MCVCECCLGSGDWEFDADGIGGSGCVGKERRWGWISKVKFWD